MDKQAYLILQNGMTFAGTRLGAEGEIAGEVVFTTGMTGYLEALTDPSYHGQILVQTFPLIGNYGVIPEDFESGAPQVRAYIVRECCQAPSNFRCEVFEGAKRHWPLRCGYAGADAGDPRKWRNERHHHGQQDADAGSAGPAGQL